MVIISVLVKSYLNYQDIRSICLQHFEIGSVSANGAHVVTDGLCLSFHKLFFNLCGFSHTFKLLIRSSTDYIFLNRILYSVVV